MFSPDAEGKTTTLKSYSEDKVQEDIAPGDRALRREKLVYQSRSARSPGEVSQYFLHSQRENLIEPGFFNP